MPEKNSSKLEKSLIRHLFDFYRVAPVGESILVLAVLAGLNNAKDDALITVCSVVFAAGGAGLASLQFSAKARLENAVRDGKFRERAFRGFTEEWCDRQTAFVVARDHGFLPEFRALIKRERESGNVRLPFIPNF